MGPQGEGEVRAHGVIVSEEPTEVLSHAELHLQCVVVGGGRQQYALVSGER